MGWHSQLNTLTNVIMFKSSFAKSLPKAELLWKMAAHFPKQMEGQNQECFSFLNFFHSSLCVLFIHFCIFRSQFLLLHFAAVTAVSLSAAPTGSVFPELSTSPQLCVPQIPQLNQFACTIKTKHLAGSCHEMCFLAAC